MKRAAAVLGVVLLAGCGGTSTSGSGSTGQPHAACVTDIAAALQLIHDANQGLQEQTLTEADGLAKLASAQKKLTTAAGTTTGAVHDAVAAEADNVGRYRVALDTNTVTTSSYRTMIDGTSTVADACKTSG